MNLHRLKDLVARSHREVFSLYTSALSFLFLFGLKWVDPEIAKKIAFTYSYSLIVSGMAIGALIHQKSNQLETQKAIPVFSILYVNLILFVPIYYFMDVTEKDVYLEFSILSSIIIIARDYFRLIGALRFGNYFLILMLATSFVAILSWIFFAKPHIIAVVSCMLLPFFIYKLPFDFSVKKTINLFLITRAVLAEAPAIFASLIIFVTPSNFLSSSDYINYRVLLGFLGFSSPLIAIMLAVNMQDRRLDHPFRYYFIPLVVAGSFVMFDDAYLQIFGCASLLILSNVLYSKLKVVANHYSIFIATAFPPIIMWGVIKLESIANSILSLHQMIGLLGTSIAGGALISYFLLLFMFNKSKNLNSSKISNK